MPNSKRRTILRAGKRRIVVATFAAVAATPAAAQRVEVGAEIASDDRRRGISWSDGEIAPGASVTLRSGGLDVGARAVATRGDPRHGGADAVVDATLGYGTELGAGLRFDGFVVGHLFAGARGRLDYGEVGGGLAYTLGPAEIAAEARYAPDQRAIGGDNLYLGGRATVGVPMTPFTLLASGGRSSGSVDEVDRAARLRPGGDYWSWSAGARAALGPVSVTVEYVGTDIARTVASPFANGRHAGDKLIARAAVGF